MSSEFLERLTCPWCGNHGTSDIVNHSGGRFLCSCGSLHNGTDPEWHRLSARRQEARDRLAKYLTVHPYVPRVGDPTEEAS